MNISNMIISKVCLPFATGLFAIIGIAYMVGIYPTLHDAIGNSVTGGSLAIMWAYASCIVSLVCICIGCIVKITCNILDI